jgi:hypothetical protein
MPTVGWIIERDTDRFERGRRAEPESAVLYGCPYCELKFATTGERRRHIGHAHSLDAPVLLLRGQRANYESTIRLPLTSAEIAIENTSECHVQDESGKWTRFSEARLRETLVEKRFGICSIRLTNRRHADESQASCMHNLRFVVPSQDDMDFIDHLFVKTLTNVPLNHTYIDDFRQNLPTGDAALAYAGALADYAQGVMFKDRHVMPCSHLGFSEFASKMQSALSVLDSINRPVPQAVCSCIALNLNNFAPLAIHPIAPKLWQALYFFESFLLEGPTSKHKKQKSGNTKPICPIDEVTDKILDAVADLIAGRKVSQEVYGLVNAGDLSEQDIVKLRVLCSYDSLQAHDSKTARKFLGLLRFDRSFGTWATERMQ